MDESIFIHRLADGTVDRIDKYTSTSELRFRRLTNGKPVLVARIGPPVNKETFSAAIRQVAAIFQKFSSSHSTSTAH